MKYRETEIFDRSDVGASGTKSIDINVVDPISRLDITWHQYEYGEMIAQPAAVMPKIELTDGSDVLFSMSGLEAQALNIYDRSVRTMNSPTTNNGNWQMITASIDFGRWLWDRQLAFDPKQFNNPQLKITFDEDACHSGALFNYLEVFAHCFDELAISPIGFLMSKVHYAYTPADDNSYHYIDLPTDYVYRQMLIRGWKNKKDPLDVVDEARLSEENDKRVVFDLNLVRYFYRMMGVWEPVIEQWNEYAKVTDEANNKFFTPTNWMTIAEAQTQGAFNDFQTVTAMYGGWMDWRGSVGNMFYGNVMGYLPNHTLSLPFGVQSEIDSWYEAQTKKSIRLRLLSSTQYAESLVSVILQQLRTY